MGGEKRNLCTTIASVWLSLAHFAVTAHEQSREGEALGQSLCPGLAKDQDNGRSGVKIGLHPHHCNLTGSTPALVDILACRNVVLGGPELYPGARWGMHSSLSAASHIVCS